jgi:hypothetical protein
MNKTILNLAYEAYDYLSVEPECIFCGAPAQEMHHWQGSKHTKALGAVNDFLITGIIPVCKKCHAEDFRGEKFLEKKINEKRLAKVANAAMVQIYLYNSRMEWR